MATPFDEARLQAHLTTVVQAHMGTLNMTLCRMQAENELLAARVAELEADLEEAHRAPSEEGT